jgi:transketolase
VSSQPDDVPLDWSEADARAVDLVRVLAMDAVQRAGSGHPGTAMSLAPAAYVLFQHVLRHDPADPGWPGRDRFVLSCGHSSLTLYIQLYLSGYGLTLDDLKAYRTWGSLTPGHPEHGLTPGVETTTGPLGHGLANAVGMAMAARVLAEGDGGRPDVVLIATGSEVQIALEAREALQREGTSARVVSMPCVEWFSEQDASYHQEVLPPGIRARVCVEAGIALGWRAFAGDLGECVSLEHFGASAAYQTLYAEFGITAQRVAEAARTSLARQSAGAGD